MAETTIRLKDADLGATFEMPDSAQALVVFAHGSGSSRLSPRNQMVARELRRSGLLGTLLFDLLTAEEDATYANRFNIALLAERLVGAVDWACNELGGDVPIGLFGASTGAAAALGAAAARPLTIRAVVSRGGRPDLAGDALPRVTVPTLLIVGGNDPQVEELNREALAALGSADKRLEIVPGATHLFDEAGTLERVAELSNAWLEHQLVRRYETVRS